MATELNPAQETNLRGRNGENLQKMCIACSWGKYSLDEGIMGFWKQQADVDLDLSCIMLNANGDIVDHIYSTFYRTEFLNRYGMPDGKMQSNDKALRHSGDNQRGNRNSEKSENESISINLAAISPAIDKIYFFLNNSGPGDFSLIPYVNLRIYEGYTPRPANELASLSIASSPSKAGEQSLILGSLNRNAGRWNFKTVGQTFKDANLCETIKRILVKFENKGQE